MYGQVNVSQVRSRSKSYQIRSYQVRFGQRQSGQVRSDQVTLMSRSYEVHVRSGYVWSSSGHVEMQVRSDLGQDRSGQAS